MKTINFLFKDKIWYRYLCTAKKFFFRLHSSYIFQHLYIKSKRWREVRNQKKEVLYPLWMCYKIICTRHTNLKLYMTINIHVVTICRNLLNKGEIDFPYCMIPVNISGYNTATTICQFLNNIFLVNLQKDDIS